MQARQVGPSQAKSENEKDRRQPACELPLRCRSKDRPLHKPWRFEGQLQRHLDLSRAADGFIDHTQAAERRASVESGRGGAAIVDVIHCRRPIDREIINESILRDVVDGNVKAGGVGEVEDLETELGADALGEEKIQLSASAGARCRARRKNHNMPAARYAK